MGNIQRSALRHSQFTNSEPGDGEPMPALPYFLCLALSARHFAQRAF
jgi:hypothetical protein